MAQPYLHPLQVNPRTGEPFLRLPSPLDNFIITPPRLSDAPALMETLNDPRVYKTLESPPFPYLPTHAESWLDMITKESDAALEEAKKAYKEGASEPLGHVETCPVRYIREIKEDGSDVFVGEIAPHRCQYLDVKDQWEREELVRTNLRYAVGDPAIVWCFGDFVAGPYHGRGIMSGALKTIMAQWLIPRMGARLIRVEAFIGNVGSVRVFEKNGFVMEKTVQYEKVTNCGVTRLGLHVLLWHAEKAS
ncbi:hypothetical protein PHLCEN_2v11382 [Hermanssonia centrifuga]|uniref:N-acetyltransferase domain-containing protein n=1 Tax=Hermanssonia centrifuga TaxID=98765 RepID=A0A2R6NK00_9APHY|nr:hypothetical protein PHLCEN_2v11382 [Hermanssonia centrifuga]